MTVHFDLHKYRQKLSVWHQIDKISDGQNDFIFFCSCAPHHRSLSQNEADHHYRNCLCISSWRIYTLRIPFNPRMEILALFCHNWLWSIAIYTSDLNWNWWKMLVTISVAEPRVRHINIDFFLFNLFGFCFVLEWILMVCKIRLCQTGNKLKYFVVKLIYIDWKNEWRCRIARDGISTTPSLEHTWFRMVAHLKCVCCRVCLV